MRHNRSTLRDLALFLECCPQGKNFPIKLAANEDAQRLRRLGEMDSAGVKYLDVTSQLATSTSRRAATARPRRLSQPEPGTINIRPRAERKAATWEDMLTATPDVPTDLREVLTDNFGRHHNYLRISLTERCNLRCLYCMPEDGVELTPSDKLLTPEELERIASLFADSGMNKIRLTGGEPLVRKDAVDIARRLGAVEGVSSMSITTNGLTLERNLEALKEAGVTKLNVSLDTLVEDKFEELTRRKGHSRVVNAIEKACVMGFGPVKVNVVLMKGFNDDEILDFVEWTKDRDVNVRFIEYMPFAGNEWASRRGKKGDLVPYKQMLETITTKYKLSRMSDDAHEVAKNFYVDGHKGSVSFVTSMTEHFCSGCNRLRIMADGNLKVCLFGDAEISLRDAIRAGCTDDELRRIITGAVKRKRKQHAGMDVLASLPNRAMVAIGG
eukprot:scaffold1504_cov417-Prasinococcus_capsulatus_cf.AAC.67